VFFPVYAALAVALVFYLVVPLVGGFALRSQWRRFRARFEELGAAPFLAYRDAALAACRGDGPVGRFRLCGRIEALEGDDRLWLRGEGVSAVVEFSRSPLYALPPDEERAGALERLPWKSVTSLAEGTRMLAEGLVVMEGGKPIFVDEPGEGLVAVSYDCEERGLGARIVAGARASNEYATPLSAVSIAIGIATMSALLLFMVGRSSLSTVRAMAFIVGILPLLPFLPPGLFLFLLYRRLWKRALSLRISRDLYRMLALRVRREERAEGEGEPRGEDATAGSEAGRLLAPGETPPPETLVLDLPAGVEDDGKAILFFAEEPRDPLDGPTLSRGDPALLAAAAARRAKAVALGSAAVLGLSLVLNYALGIALWRLLS